MAPGRVKASSCRSEFRLTGSGSEVNPSEKALSAADFRIILDPGVYTKYGSGSEHS